MNKWYSLKIDFKFVVKIFLFTTIITLLLISFSEAGKKKDKDEKDCVYCKKYEKLKDWPENERPIAFTYEEINYPEGMFSNQRKTSKLRQEKAGKKVYARFVKEKVT